jgi:very-short-patch-repair endonuclease
LGRSAELKKWGLKIIRFTNNEIDTNIAEVIRKIQIEIELRKIEIMCIRSRIRFLSHPSGTG